MVVLLSLLAYGADDQSLTDGPPLTCAIAPDLCMPAPPPPPAQDTRIARWTEVANTGPVTGPDGRTWRWVPWGGGPPLELDCGEKPTIMGMARGVYVTSHHTQRSDDTTWILPPAPRAAPWNGWLVHPHTCEVKRLRTSAGPWAWALAERLPAQGEWEPLLAGQDRWEWASQEPLRQAALRPPGPHPVSWHLKQGVKQHKVEGKAWTLRTPSDSVALEGPARVLADVRALGLTDTACIVVDDVQRCRLSSPSRGVEIRDEQLHLEPRTLDGKAVHRQNRFRIALGPGKHTLKVSQDSLTRVMHHRHEPWNGLPTLPEGVRVGEEPGDIEWETAVNEGGVGTWLMGRAPRPILREAPHWAPLDDIPPDARPPSDQHLDVWMQPNEDDTVCTVKLGSLQTAAMAPRGVHRFAWVGPSPIPTQFPAVDGCEAWVRVVGAMSERGRSLSWHKKLLAGERLLAHTHPDKVARIEVALPISPGEVRLTATAPGGLVREWTLVASEQGPERITAEGEQWSDPVPLPLPMGASQWLIEVSGIATVRVRQPADVTDDNDTVEGVATSVTEAIEPEVPDDMSIRGASRRVAEAATTPARVRALLHRAEVLLDQGRPALAGRDLVLAERLDAEVRTLTGPMVEQLRVLRERTLFGADRWLPKNPEWVTLPMVPPDNAERELVQAAGAGDALTVATQLPGDEALRWWRRALQGGQVATSPQRLHAFTTAIQSRQPDNPSISSLRSLSRWEPVVWLTGPSVRQHVTWPTPERTDDVLYPDPWPTAQIVPISQDWQVRLPPRGTPMSLPVRCRTTSLPSLGDCVVEVRDGDRHLLKRLDLAPWGATETLRIPAGAVAYVNLRTSHGHTAQIRWQRTKAPGAMREAWRAAGGRPVVAHVLGPTVLRVQSLSGANPAVSANGEEVPGRRASDGSWLVPLHDAGPVTVSITPPESTWIRVATRRSTSGGPEPLTHVHGVGQAPGFASGVPLLEPVDPDIPVGMPVSEPRSWTAEAMIGSAEVPPSEAHSGLRVPLALTARAGLESRVRDGLWLDGDVGAQARLDGTVLALANAGGDVVIRSGRTRVYALGDLRLAAGPFSGVPLGTARMDLAAHLSRDLGRSWQLHSRLRASARLRTPLDVTAPYSTGRTLLWSRYADNHRAQLHGLVSLRRRWGPWWAARAELRATTNAPGGGPPIDLVGADAILDASRPNLRVRLRAGAEIRLPDAHRTTTQSSLILDGRVQRTIWRSPTFAISPWLRGRVRPFDNTASAMVGVQTRWGPPRGLQDVRPSQIAERHASEAGFWREAQKRWPVNFEAPTDDTAGVTSAAEAL